MNETEKRIRGSHSEAFQQLNPGLFGAAVGALQGQVVQPDQGKALERDLRREKKRPRSLRNVPHNLSVRPVLRVTIIAFTRRTLDLDNCIAGCKHIRDRLAEEFCLDDSEKQIDWQYASVPTRGEQGVIVRIEAI